jgi:hypothetical protein
MSSKEDTTPVHLKFRHVPRRLHLFRRPRLRPHLPQIIRGLEDVKMSDRGNDRNPGLLAQDAKITARADGYGPVGKGGQQVKTRPPAPAPMVKSDNAAQPAAIVKPPSK